MDKSVGTYGSPLPISVEPKDWEYPEQFKDRSHVYVLPPSGTVTKVYRSYSDYCD